jgi:hypothetical protein
VEDQVWLDGFNETLHRPLALQIQTITRTKFYIKKTLFIYLLLSLAMEAKIDVIKQKTYMNLMENLAIH